MRTCGVDGRYGLARWGQEGPGDDQSNAQERRAAGHRDTPSAGARRARGDRQASPTQAAGAPAGFTGGLVEGGTVGRLASSQRGFGYVWELSQRK